jgi:hypothetical protein
MIQKNEKKWLAGGEWVVCVLIHAVGVMSATATTPETAACV